MNLIKLLAKFRTKNELLPDKQWKQNLLNELRQKIYPAAAPRGNFMSLFNPRFTPVKAFLGIAVFLFVGSGGLVFASKNALPGETLYAVKTTAEQIEKFMAVSPETKVIVNTEIAQERTRELELLIEKNADSQLIKTASIKIAEETESIIRNINNAGQISEKSLQTASTGIENNLSVLRKFTVASMPLPSDNTIVEESAKTIENTARTVQPDEQPLPLTDQASENTPAISTEPQTDLTAEPLPTLAEPEPQTPTPEPASAQPAPQINQPGLEKEPIEPQPTVIEQATPPKENATPTPAQPQPETTIEVLPTPPVFSITNTAVGGKTLPEDTFFEIVDSIKVLEQAKEQLDQRQKGANK